MGTGVGRANAQPDRRAELITVLQAANRRQAGAFLWQVANHVQVKIERDGWEGCVYLPACAYTESPDQWRAVSATGQSLRNFIAMAKAWKQEPVREPEGTGDLGQDLTTLAQSVGAVQESTTLWRVSDHVNLHVYEHRWLAKVYIADAADDVPCVVDQWNAVGHTLRSAHTFLTFARPVAGSYTHHSQLHE